MFPFDFVVDLVLFDGHDLFLCFLEFLQFSEFFVFHFSFYVLFFVYVLHDYFI